MQQDASADDSDQHERRQCRQHIASMLIRRRKTGGVQRDQADEPQDRQQIQQRASISRLQGGSNVKERARDEHHLTPDQQRQQHLHQPHGIRLCQQRRMLRKFRGSGVRQQATREGEVEREIWRKHDQTTEASAKRPVYQAGRVPNMRNQNGHTCQPDDQRALWSC